MPWGGSGAGAQNGWDWGAGWEKLGSNKKPDKLGLRSTSQSCESELAVQGYQRGPRGPHLQVSPVPRSG